MLKFLEETCGGEHSRSLYVKTLTDQSLALKNWLEPASSDRDFCEDFFLNIWIRLTQPTNLPKFVRQSDCSFLDIAKLVRKLNLSNDRKQVIHRGTHARRRVQILCFRFPTALPDSSTVIALNLLRSQQRNKCVSACPVGNYRARKPPRNHHQQQVQRRSRPAGLRYQSEGRNARL